MNWNPDRRPYIPRSKYGLRGVAQSVAREIKIDRASKEIKWILGDHKGWSGEHKNKLLQPEHDLRWHYHGHNPG